MTTAEKARLAYIRTNVARTMPTPVRLFNPKYKIVLGPDPITDVIEFERRDRPGSVLVVWSKTPTDRGWAMVLQWLLHEYAGA